MDKMSEILIKKNFERQIELTNYYFYYIINIKLLIRIDILSYIENIISKIDRQNVQCTFCLLC